MPSSIGSEPPDLGERLAEPRARHDAILDDVVGREPADCREGALSPLPVERALVVVLGLAHLGRTGALEHLEQLLELAVDGLVVALELDDQERLDALRIARLD